MSIDPRLLHGGLDADVDIDTPVVESDLDLHTDLAPEPGPSKLTLRIPSLKALKEAKKSSSRSGLGSPINSSKTPRPQKLKPLKEVLMGLITKIKKKDDYAFFLTPVDPAAVPGYADVIKQPMDFGTMTQKVARGRYRLLEDFTADFRLVIANAKAFNPPGSIYYTEAERIESWGNEAIDKASAQVIQSDANWSIDVDGSDHDVTDDGETMQSPAVGAGDRPRSVSLSADAANSHGLKRRAAVAAAEAMAAEEKEGKGRGHHDKEKKGADGVLGETLEEGGHLPGYEYGVGRFPPESDWAETMLALKIKGKRYKTKKERLARERDGPPITPDGSIDYAELEDPFTHLSALLPAPFTAPVLSPLYPSPASEEPHALPPPATAPPPSAASMPVPKISTTTKGRRKYWTLTRTGPVRKRDQVEETSVTPQTEPQIYSRPIQTTDFGAYAHGPLARELLRVRPMNEGQLLDHLGATLRPSGIKSEKELDKSGVVSNGGVGGYAEEMTYFTHDRARAAEAYLDEVLYGGPTGLAYLQSIARFVAPPRHAASYVTPSSATKPAFDVREEKTTVKAEEPDKMVIDPSIELKTLTLPLGMPLATYAEAQVADRVTGGAHRLVMLLAHHLSSGSHPRPLSFSPSVDTERPIFPFSQQTTPTLLGKFAHASANVLPTLWSAFRELDNGTPLDLAGLIKDAKELFVAEEVWAGRGVSASGDATAVAAGEAEALLRAMKHVGALIGKVADRQAAGNAPARSATGARAKSETQVKRVKKENDDGDVAMRGPEEEEESDAEPPSVPPTSITAHLSSDLSTSVMVQDSEAAKTDATAPAATNDEDPVLREVRLNLIALAKRAPLDRIGPMPPQLVALVPAHLRSGIPTSRP